MTHTKDFTKGKSVFCTTDNISFVSCVEAGVFYKVHPSYIGQACNGKYKDIRGKHFCWLTDKDIFVPQPKETKRKCGPKPKAVLCLTDGKEFPSVRETAQFYGIPQSGISDVCNGKLQKTHGMLFCFVADKEKHCPTLDNCRKWTMKDCYAVDKEKANIPVKVKIKLHRKGVK